MKKITLLILGLLAFFLFSINSSALDTCRGASMCAGLYTLRCGDADGYCPEDYGEWNTCEDNPTYGGGCTLDCDPDCTTFCGDADTIKKLKIYCDPLVVDVGTQVNVIANVINAAGDELRIYKGNSVIGAPIWQKTLCTTGDCTLTATEPVKYPPGTVFYYTTTTDNIWQDEGRSATAACITRPICDININPTRVQGTQKFISSTATVSLSVDSSAGVSSRTLSFFKWNKNLNAFSPMTPPEQGCSISSCNVITNPNCNKLINHPSDTYMWDTTKCENGDYRVTLDGIDNNNNSCTDSDEATIEGSSICVDECGIFSSKIINTIIVKIKSWI